MVFAMYIQNKIIPTCSKGRVIRNHQSQTVLELTVRELRGTVSKRPSMGLPAHILG